MRKGNLQPWMIFLSVKLPKNFETEGTSERNVPVPKTTDESAKRQPRSEESTPFAETLGELKDKADPLSEEEEEKGTRLHIRNSIELKKS